MTRVACALVLLGLTGCGGDPPVAPVDASVGGAGAAAVELVPLVDGGDDVTLVAGAQGGFHVWLDWRLRGVPAGSTVTLERRAFRVADEAVVLRFDGAVDVGAPGDDGWFAPLDPIPMFMCPSPIGVSVVDVPIRFELHVLAGAGELARTAVTLTPRCPDAQRDFCTRICTG